MGSQRFWVPFHHLKQWTASRPQNMLYLHMQFVSTCDRLGDVRWKLCVIDTSGKQHWCSADCSEVFKSSVCVRWYSLQLPPLPRLKTLQVFAFVPVFFNRKWKPHGDRSVPCCYCFLKKTVQVTRWGESWLQYLQNCRVSQGLWICLWHVLKSLKSPSWALHYFLNPSRIYLLNDVLTKLLNWWLAPVIHPCVPQCDHKIPYPSTGSLHKRWVELHVIIKINQAKKVKCYLYSGVRVKFLHKFNKWVNV